MSGFHDKLFPVNLVPLSAALLMRQNGHRGSCGGSDFGLIDAAFQTSSVCSAVAAGDHHI